MKKLYTWDFGWHGALAVVASSLEEAYKIANTSNFVCDRTPKEHKIATGLIVEFDGDA